MCLVVLHAINSSQRLFRIFPFSLYTLLQNKKLASGYWFAVYLQVSSSTPLDDIIIFGKLSEHVFVPDR